MKKSLIRVTEILAVAALVLAGCGKAPTQQQPVVNAPLPEPPLVATCTPGIPGGRMVVASYGDPKTFNPITANESTSDNIDRLLFSALLGFDSPSQEVLPGLAESWSVAPDNKTWTFKLRKNLRWSDGAPLTADDVVFTWNDIVYNTNINNVTRDIVTVNGKPFKVTKVDDLTVKIVTPEVFAPFLLNAGAGVPIMPKHILGKAVAEGTFLSSYGVNTPPQDIVGSGPFRVKEYKTAQYTLLERNPYFFEVDKKGHRLPYFDNIIFTSVPDMNALALQFLSGESDADDFIYPSDYDEFKAESAKGRFRLEEPGIGLETTYFWFNENTNVNRDTGRPYVPPRKLKWFRNVKFRQACSYAIDRESIIQSIYFGRAIPNYGLVTPGNKKWYNPNIQKYPHDVAKARELLKEIGMVDRNGDGVLEDADGNPVEFVLNTNTGNGPREKTVVLIASDLKKLGLKVTPQSIDFNTLVDKISNTYDYECVLMGLGGGGTDPSSYMNVVKSDGFTHEWFPREKTPSTPWEARLDVLMNDQNQTLDQAKRKKDFDEVQAILAEQVPLIFTVTPYYYAAIRSDVGNVRPTPLSYYRVTWNAEELYFKKP